MHRTIRNRLTDLLLGALRDHAKRDAMLLFSLYCTLHARQQQLDLPLMEVQREWTGRYPARTLSVQDLAHTAAWLEGLLQFRPRDLACAVSAASTSVRDAVEIRVGAHPDLVPSLAAACERVRLYAQVVVEAGQAGLEGTPTLRRAVVEAALCFNAGLFFEAHEHLEHHWVGLPPNPTKRFLQGLVQISVGFHHAMRGSYEGTVNQLQKGLEKLAVPTSETFGVDVSRLQHEAMEVRQKTVARGRPGMRKAVLDELPRMHLIR